MIHEELTKTIIGCAYKVYNAHEVQLVNYLTATGNEVGLILNFAETKVEVKRKIRNLKKSE